MKGLLLKDWYTLIKQMKIMLVLMLVFACVPGYSMAAFALLFTACLALIMLAIYLPVMFRLGVEKGRVLFMILICASAAAGVILSDKLSALIDGIGSPVAAALVLLVIAAAAQIASFEVSVRFYEMKRK